jgi:hypothetical protein
MSDSKEPETTVDAASRPMRCSTVLAVRSGETFDQYLHHLFEAKKRGMALRTHECSVCQKSATLEFEEGTLVQTKYYNCECGSLERVVFHP